MSRTLATTLSLVAVIAGCHKSDRAAGAPPATLDRAGPTGAALAALGAAPPPTGPAIPLSTLAATPPPRAALKSFAGAQATGFTISYARSQNAELAQLQDVLANGRVLEQLAESLNRTIRIPAQVDITVADCNAINAYYDPSTKRVFVCTELVAHFLQTFKSRARTEDDLGNAVIGATAFVAIHEIGHGLIHLLNLPAVGREEDSVDQLATLTLIASGDRGVSMALAGAYWFQLQTESGDKTPMSDEHPFNAQRYYNVICLLYGADPHKRAQLAGTTLPKERAERCPDEHRKIAAAWERLLQPHLTRAGAANVDYAPPPPPPPAPTPAPAPTPTPTDELADVEVVAEDGGSSCEAVADKIAELSATDAMTRAGGEATEELERQLETQLPAVMQQILARCTSEAWPEALRACVVRAESMTAADACKR